RRQPQSVRLQEIFGPLRAQEWPFIFAAQHEPLIGMTHIQRDARLALPAGIFTFEEVAKKTFLQGFAIFAVEMSKMGVAMHFEPFLFGACSPVAFEIAARVQSHAAPIGSR